MFISNSGARQYTIANSLRFRSSASANLNRTYAGTGTSATIKTFSAWVKRGALGSVQRLLNSNAATATTTYLQFDAADTLSFNFEGASTTLLTTSQVFRDPSAHYHILLAIDTTQATAANRVKFYINGSQVTAFSAANYPALNATTTLMGHASANNRIGSIYDGTGNYFDGLLAETYFIDGQALTPSSFGQTDTNGVWVPKAYSGTYGTNGFYLKFNDGSSTTNLCLDRSGNGNNWTPNNISLTAGATYDWMVDTPTNNYAAMNWLDKNASGTMADGNLKWTAGASQVCTRGNVAIPSSGKFYMEALNVNATNATIGVSFGLAASTVDLGTSSGASGLYQLYASANRQVNINNSTTGSASGGFSANDILQIAVDVDNSKMYLGVNNTWYDATYTATTIGGTATSTASMVGLFPFSNCYQNSVHWNFGQRPFTYTPPTGFKALCTSNLPAVNSAAQQPKKHFDIASYAGTGSPQTVSGMAFSPEFLWIKGRTTAGQNHLLNDIVRGATASLYSDQTSAENAFPQYGSVTAFNSNGFSTVAGGTSGINVNATSNNYVAWAWKANGTGVTNTAGSITSTVSANTTAGFSIVTYTGTGANATVGHGLGTVPKMVIVKNRTGASVAWRVWHTALAGTEGLELNGTSAKFTETTLWNSTVPTSTVFSVGSSSWTNQNTLVAYVFSEVPGFSKFGSYTGNGSADGPFVYCGFRPRYVMVKRTDSAGFEWVVIDTARDTYNVMGNDLYPNTSGADVAGVNRYDFTANGFKVRTTGNNFNASSGTYIFAAFAESPFGGSNVSPATAR